jgi:hypothetical protein
MPKTKGIGNSHLCTHKCAHCQKNFSHPSNAKRHLVIHSQNPFQCKICDKSFSQRCNARRHITTMHRSINPNEHLQCRIHLFSKQCHNCTGHFLLTNKDDKTKFCDTCFNKASDLQSFDIVKLLESLDIDLIPIIF